MPSLEPDQNINGLVAHQQAPHLSTSTHASDNVQEPPDDIPHLTSNIYKPTAPTRPVISTTFPHSRIQNADTVTPLDDRSPDPHDFYRTTHESRDKSLRMGDLSLGRTHGGSSSRPSRARTGSPRSSQESDTNMIKSPLSARVSNARNALSPHQERPPHTSNKSPSTFSNVPRNRQTSLQELVNRFNQTPDEVPPLPDKTKSRSPSTSSSIRAPLGRSGTAPLAKSSGRGYSASFSSDSYSLASSREGNQRRGRTQGSSAGSPKSRKPPSLQGSATLPAKPFASQSMVDLAPEIDALPRKPLFGELFSPEQRQTQVGYGIPQSKRRRGSEGSMNSPNPLYADQTYMRYRDPSPPSPAAWYYGHTPPLNEIKAKGDIPDPAPNIHRRTRSESQGLTSGQFHHEKYVNRLSPPTSPTADMSSRRTSQSRLPISTARRVSEATSEDLPTLAADHFNPAAKGAVSSTGNRAPPPKPLQPTRTSPHYSRSNTPQRSPRYQNANSRSTHSPRLAAYIAEPLPKKSPPLRSSRPRQPVSSASTSASRARAVEKLSTRNDHPRTTREARPRKPPELGAVDFAARRQKIQQAFNQTVKEEEEREIRRMSMALEAQSLENVTAGNVDQKTDSQASNLQSQPISELEPGNAAGIHGPHEGSTQQRDADLSINTSRFSERSVLDLDDSPTLGAFNTSFASDGGALGANGSTPNSDIDPGSAITAGTSDSVDTFFDDEPQDLSHGSSRRPSTAQQISTLDNKSLQASRTPSPVGPSRLDGVEDRESGDGRESIQIMLGATPILEKARYGDEYEDRSKDGPSSEDPDSRWSMSTWTSSIRSSDDRDSQLERIEEGYPATSSAPNHMSLSSTASEGEAPQPSWSPSSQNSPRTDRTTMDSDRYSTINRVLDQYHANSPVTRDGAHDGLQHPYNQSPDLIRSGGYDTRKVTQLYMQKMARDQNTGSGVKADGAKVQISKRTSSLALPNATSEKEVRTDMDEKMLPATGHNRNLSASSANDYDVDEDGNLKPARASLSRPGDFDMSPSLGGFSEMAADTPQEERPPLPEKDAPFMRLQRRVEHHDHNAPQPNRNENDARPQLPPINFGQNLEIKVEPPQRNNSPNDPHAMSEASVRNHSSDTWDGSRHDRSIPPSMTSDGPSKPRETSSARNEEPSKDASPSEEQKRLTRRRHIIKELVDTEHSFGQDMKVVDDIYKGTSNVIIISGEDVKTLFANSDQIVNFSTTFLDSLKQAARPVYVLAKSKRWKSNRVSNATSYSTTGDEASINGVELSDEQKDLKTTIGESFGSHMSMLEKIYTEYLKNHDYANQKLQQLQKNPKVQIWLKECKAYASDLTTAWNLDSLLVKPVQRLLKYPLLLSELIEVTPENHPDFTALEIALREIKGVSMRINEVKRRTEILEQVTSNNRKRKDSDMRTGLAKAFGAGKKLRQQVGATNAFEDKEFNTAADRFSEHFVRLQIIMRDVEMYSRDVDTFVKKFLDFAVAMEAHIDVGQTSYPELESKWRKFRMSMRDMSTIALPDHIEQVQKHVVQPMQVLVKLQEGPQKLMQKRNKRLADHARFRTLNLRGDKPDKKTIEQSEQFLAVNETLKDEVPKLLDLTSKLMGCLLSNFVQLQYKWLKLWKLKLKQAIDIPSASQDSDSQAELSKIVRAFSQDFAFYEAQVASLGVCNGALLNETPNLVQFASPATSNGTVIGDHGEGVVSPRAGPSFDSRRTHSVSSDQSPVLPQPDFGDNRGNGGFFPIGDATAVAAQQRQAAGNRNRTASNVSTSTPQTPQVPGSWRSYSNNTTPLTTTPGRHANASTRMNTDPSPSVRPSTESSRMYRTSDESALTRPSPGTSYTQYSHARSNSPSGNRFSGYFSSAMPMSDSPPSESPTQPAPKEYNVIFLAASVYEFNIDRARKEAGYPYLTYVAGEIFDVIGEKGELWLAKNQDDRNSLVGWIWNKHFVKLAG